MEWKSLSELKEEAESLCPTHHFPVWESYGTYGRPKDNAHAKCIYCNAEVYVKEFSKEEKITGSALTQECLSAGRTTDPEGLSVTTWSFCRKCDKKLNPKNHNEVLKGFHTRCQNRYDGTIVLDIHDGMIQLAMKVE